MKLILCSNRLPLTIKKADKSFEYTKTSGGLVTGIESLTKEIKFTWFGNISGIDLDEKEKKQITIDVFQKFNCMPVFIDPELNSLCYDGFCNAILWPTIHSFPDNVCFTYKEYDAYVKYNEIFAKKILLCAKSGDIVWVHDYHLMLVPELIKKANPNIKVLFFLHTAFCEPNNLKPLLCAKHLLRSLSQCDVVGFHTPEYASNFTMALKEYQIEKTPQIRAVSIGIEPEMFREQLKKQETIDKIKELRKKYKGKRIILGVDRTDYIKGMPQRFKGIEKFLQKQGGNAENFVFLQVAIPSRLDVQEYSGYVEQINRQIEHVNSTIGSINHTPIKMIFHTVKFDELCALYAVSEAILITSIMDGMNLVAMEYVACQDELKGSVILSEWTGATCTLQGSVFHNGNNSEEIAMAIEEAIGLNSKQREENHKINKRAIDNFTSVGWASQTLDQVGKEWRNTINKEHKNK